MSKVNLQVQEIESLWQTNKSEWTFESFVSWLLGGCDKPSKYTQNSIIKFINNHPEEHIP